MQPQYPSMISKRCLLASIDCITKLLSMALSKGSVKCKRNNSHTCSGIVIISKIVSMTVTCLNAKLHAMGFKPNP